MKTAPALKLTFLVALVILLDLAGCNKAENRGYQGYIEGEYVYLAASSAGYLNKLFIPKGSSVVEGTPVFLLAADMEQQAQQETEAPGKRMHEKLHKLSELHLKPEVATLEAQVRVAEVAVELSEKQLQQQESLAKKGFISPANLDEFLATHDRNKAQLVAARQQLNTYAVSAPTDGEISEIYYRQGEWVQAGQPVVSLLPNNRRLIRFFVPESVVASVHLGGTVEVTCDGCTVPIRGIINFISPKAEYTPPVIYSHGSREKMVFRIEALPPVEQAMLLRPGLPIDVRFTGQ